MTRIYSDEAELYDIAFDWDLGPEADWLVERLGPSCRSVLEPGCGTGRMLEALAHRGLEVTGYDVSQQMVASARARLARARFSAEVFVADMTEFDLGRRFGGAVSPINTLGHLSPNGLARHLERMAAHLSSGARYLVQLGLPTDGDELWRSEWEAGRDGVDLRIVWEALERDPARLREIARSRVEILTGPRAGEVVEDLHTMTRWTAAAWRGAIAQSPFGQVGYYDGNVPDRPAVALEQGGGLLWHELVAP